METLVEKAKKLEQEKKVKRKWRSKEHQDLALAWLKGEVTSLQVGKTIYPSSDIYYTSCSSYFLNSALKSAYEEGRIKIV